MVKMFNYYKKTLTACKWLVIEPFIWTVVIKQIHKLIILNKIFIVM